MSDITRLIDIPSKKYPLNWDRYTRLMKELNGIAGGFADIGYTGNQRAEVLARTAAHLHHSLYLLWNDVQNSERAEKAESESSLAVAPHGA